MPLTELPNMAQAAQRCFMKLTLMFQSLPEHDHPSHLRHGRTCGNAVHDFCIYSFIFLFDYR